MGCVGLVTLVLALLPHRRTIPPAVESDYCYQLIAADRFLAGHGLTSLQPVAPLQPWGWRYDWGFLTQWPAGYSLLVASVRYVVDLPTVSTCQWISLVACAFALVGWFVWLRQCTRRGGASVALSLLAAGSAVSMSSLVNPSTDILIVAALPWVLLLASKALRESCDSIASPPVSADASLKSLALAGFNAGLLVWFRYAAVFIPVGILLFLCLRAGARPCRRTLYSAGAFGATAAIPVAALWTTNSTLGPALSTTERFNLGAAFSPQFSWTPVMTAWRQFTNLGFYDYHTWVATLTAVVPLIVLALLIFARRVRERVFVSICRTNWAISAVVVLTGLLMLVGATALFGSKYDYVSLDRYYEPMKPLYFALFVAPWLCVRARFVRAGFVIAAIVGGSWIVRQDWLRTYDRWASARRETTAYGQWATCFSPGARDVYEWLRAQASPELIVVSNFHEYITLETGLPALPIPGDRSTLERWVAGIVNARALRAEPRIVFVLDDTPRWRDYWIPPTSEIVDRLRLGPPIATFQAAAAFMDRELTDAKLAGRADHGGHGSVVGLDTKHRKRRRKEPPAHRL